MAIKVFYAAGPGNIIQAHKDWRKGQQTQSEFSITYSSQMADACRDAGVEIYMVSSNAEKGILRDGRFLLEHRPKPWRSARGWRYHVAQVSYGLMLCIKALRFRADIVAVNSGSTHFFVMSICRLCRMRVVPVLHNTLWPTGFPPATPIARIISRLDSYFFRWFAAATIGVSPECLRQVDDLTGGRHGRVLEIRAQYSTGVFARVSQPPPHARRPFRIIFSGRISRDKGVFDILSIARRVDELVPRQVLWEVCGAGPDLAEMQRDQVSLGLESIVTIRGWTAPAVLVERLAESHLAIVPTRSTFAEGMAKTAVEAVLSGRPVLTSRVVPALEVLRPACIEAVTDDVESYAACVVDLMNDAPRYHALCEACIPLQAQFYDHRRGLAAAWATLFDEIRSP